MVRRIGAIRQLVSDSLPVKQMGLVCSNRCIKMLGMIRRAILANTRTLPRPAAALLRLLGTVVLLLAGGCVLLPATDNEEGTSSAYDHVLPAGWTAVGDWVPVNLDGDDEDENLLLFRFDNGQVGAQIVEGDPTTTISPPHRLLPRYFDDGAALGHGVIAPPFTPSRAITVTQVNGNVPARELVILAQGTHLTFAWWRGTRQGYGVTQLVAPGGFGVDWETWLDDPTPINAVVGYTPLDDYRARANLCTRTHYTRRTDLPADVPAIIFRAEDMGLHFCGSVIPSHPYAPEGVVMAYMHWPRADTTGLINLLTPGTTLAQLDAESVATRWPMERVADIAAYPSVTMPHEGEAETVLSPTTAVCVEFAELANPALRRWLVYTLRFQPPVAQQRLPERWTVSGAFAEPAPPAPPPDHYCREVLNRRTP